MGLNRAIYKGAVYLLYLLAFVAVKHALSLGDIKPVGFSLTSRVKNKHVHRGR